MAIVVVTPPPRMGFAREMGDRVIFMAEGVVVEEATPDKLFTNPAEDRTKEFLDKVL